MADRAAAGAEAGPRPERHASVPRPMPPADTWQRRIRLRHLEVLRIIAQEGSLTAAAVALDITQPAVSQWLADIEAALGERLFIRGQRLRPTPFAAPVLAHAERVLRDAQHLGEQVRAIREGGTGQVRIGAMQVANVTLVPAMVLQMQKEAPGVELSLVEGTAAELWARFERNELDLLITRLEARALASGLPHRRLFSDHHRVVCKPGHALLRRRRPGWADVAVLPWVMPPADTPLRLAVEATFAAQGLALPPVILASGSSTVLTALLGRTDALAVMSSLAAAHFEAQGALRCLNLTLTHDIGDVGLVWQERQPGAALDLVLSCLERCSRALGNAA